MDGQIKESRGNVFTEWGECFRRRTREAPDRRPATKDDMAPLRSRFDAKYYGLMNSQGRDFGRFKVMATNPDGSQTARTLAQLGITKREPEIRRIRGQTYHEK